MRASIWLALALAIVAAGAFASRDASALPPAKIYEVDTTAADPAGTLHNCDFPAPNGCSLVGAINQANLSNSSLGPDSIVFKIGQGGVQTITPSSQLPAITQPVIIDGTGQDQGTNTCGDGLAPCVILDGTSAGPANGLIISSNGVTVKGLAIVHFSAGIEVKTGINSAIKGNFVGTANGTTAGPNSTGVAVDLGASDITIGGTTSTERNVISGNNNDGVYNDGANVTIEGNYIGTSSDGISALPNEVGIDMHSGGATIGGTDAGAGNLISGNQAGGNGVGLLIHHASAMVEGNLVGLNAAGTGAVPNDTGINLQVAGEVTIGGTTPEARNVISGNDQGLFVISAGTIISGNYIGTNAAGDAAVPNATYGIMLESAYNAMIGGPDAGSRNVISGNGQEGISIGGQGSGAPGVTVQGNYIGLNAAGTAAVANGDGVYIQPVDVDMVADDNTIAGNVISGNQAIGIAINPIPGIEADHNTITGNMIGTNPAGDTPIGNLGGALLIEGDSNIITSNTIAGNGGGVDLNGSNEILQSNYIGTNSQLDPGLGNSGRSGVYVYGNSNHIGDDTSLGDSANSEPEAAPSLGNVIMFNAGYGIYLENNGADHTWISRNSIDDNGDVGIHVEPGANEDVVPPVLTEATASNGSTHVTGTLTPTTSGPFDVEFFASPACDPSGSGEGRTYLGTITLPITGGTIDATLPTAISGRQVITATTTDDGYNTSQFSNCVTVSGPTPTPTPSPTPTPTPTGGAAILGDANCDGNVDSDDVTAVLAHSGGFLPDASCLSNADANCDSAIDAADALAILRHMADVDLPQPSGCPAIGSAIT